MLLILSNLLLALPPSCNKDAILRPSRLFVLRSRNDSHSAPSFLRLDNVQILLNKFCLTVMRFRKGMEVLDRNLA